MSRPRRTDAELVAAAARPETFDDAITEIFEKYRPWVVDVCRRALREDDEVGDATQVTFEQLVKEFTGGSPLREGAALRGYLKTIAQRQSMRFMRGGRPGKGHRPTADPIGISDDVGVAVRDEAGDHDWETVDRAIGTRRVEHVMNTVVVPSLSASQQAIYDASYRRGLTGRALEEAVGLREGEGRKLLNRLSWELSTGFLGWALWQDFRGGCARLDAIVTEAEAAHGAMYSASLREAIASHVLTRKGEDKCAVCGPHYRTLKVGWRPVLLPFVLLGWLRERFRGTVDAAVQTVARIVMGGAEHLVGSVTRPRDRRKVGVGVITGAALVIVAILIGAAVILGVLPTRTPGSEPQTAVALDPVSLSGSLGDWQVSGWTVTSGSGEDRGPSIWRFADCTPGAACALEVVSSDRGPDLFYTPPLSDGDLENTPFRLDFTGSGGVVSDSHRWVASCDVFADVAPIEYVDTVEIRVVGTIETAAGAEANRMQITWTSVQTPGPLAVERGCIASTEVYAAEASR